MRRPVPPHVMPYHGLTKSTQSTYVAAKDRRYRLMNKNSIIFVGLDLGDKLSYIALLGRDGALIEETRLPSTECRVDAEPLARLAPLDPELPSPIHHRSPKAQAHLAVIRSRDALVRVRTLLINHVRGIAKSSGDRLPSCSADCFAGKVASAVPEPLLPALLPVLDTIASLSDQIRAYDRQIASLCQENYPETRHLQSIAGVGPLTSLAFVLTLENPQRFARSRQVGPALGLVPKRDQSGDRDPQLRITKTGDSYLRRLLVGSAQYILGPFGLDCDLRRWGLKLAERGGENAKRRAIVAVARKLAIFLHHLWTNRVIYDLLY